MRRMTIWYGRLPRLMGAAMLTVALLAEGRGAQVDAHSAAIGAARTPLAPRALPLAFEPGPGQGGANDAFLARAGGYDALIGPATLHIAVGGTIVRLSFLNANAHARIVAEDRLPGVVSYFEGRDPRLWRTGIPTYARLRVHNLYPGIDLVYYTGSQGLEYDLLVSPGADPGIVRIAVAGAAPRIVGGNLVWRTAAGTLALAAPTIYQPGVHARPAGGYQLGVADVLTFRLGRYDHARALVIDPYLKVIGTSGYNSIGGTGTAIAMDGAGNTYVTGTGGGQFPTTRGAALTTLANQDVANSAIVVMKYSPTGTLLFSTYLGTVYGNGTTGVSSAGIAVDGAGNVYVTGSTEGTNFPLVHPLISYPAPDGCCGSLYHAFVAKLNPTGTRILYTTYLAGDLASHGWAIVADQAGNAYVAGSTAADENPDNRQFPVTARRRHCAPGTDGFVAMINPTGSKLLSAFCIGNTGTTRALGIALDQAHNVYVTGYTNDYPPKAALRLVSQQPGTNNAFVIKYNPTQTKLLYLAFLGGGGDTSASAIAVDRAGDVFITGSTTGGQFPTTPGAFMRGQAAPTAGVAAAFVAKINPAGTRLLYSTYLSGNTDDVGTGIAVDTHGDAFVAGTIARNLNMAVSAGDVTFPVTKGAMYTKFNVNGDGFLTEINPGGTGVRSSTMLGGVIPGAVALGPNGHPALTGSVTQQDPQDTAAKDTWFVVWSL